MLKKLLCLVAILSMAGVANAAVDWIGNNDGVGDNTSFNDGLNWDDHVNPSNNSWNILRRNYYPYTPVQNWDIHITGDIYTQTGWVYNGVTQGAGACTISLTVDNGVNWTSGTAASPVSLNWYNPGSLNIIGNADLRYCTVNMESSGTLTVNIAPTGYIYTSTLRYNNNNWMNVSGTLRAWTFSRIDAAYDRFKVLAGGLVQVDSGIPAAGVGWSKGGKITMYLDSTVQLAANVSAYYLQLVQASPESGIGTWWEVDYGVTKAGYTTIKYMPEPATALFLLAGLPLLRRRRA